MILSNDLKTYCGSVRHNKEIIIKKKKRKKNFACTKNLIFKINKMFSNNKIEIDWLETSNMYVPCNPCNKSTGILIL